MKSFTKMHLILAASVLMFGAGSAIAQHEHPDTAPATADQPKHPEKSAGPSKSVKPTERVGDPYALDACPITGKKLGTMGDPVVKVYEGREVRFCCPACPPKFEKDLAGNFGKIDEKIIQDQSRLYPLKTSLVTGKDLPDKPYEFVYSNRLIRLGGEDEKAQFLKHPAPLMVALDKAAIEQQGTHYPLTTCPVSKDAYGGDMGKPVDQVVAGRLVRLCCKDCKKELERDPAKYVAMVDAAHHADKGRPDADHKEGHDDHKHGGG